MRKIRETICDKGCWSEGWIPENLQAAIVWLQAKLDEIPHDMREQATIEFDSDYESSEVRCEITGVRDETQQEIAQRMLQEEQSNRTQALFREAQERAAYEALKRKFG